MTLFTDAYIMALLPRSTRRVFSPREGQPAVLVTQDGVDLSLGALAYKAVSAVEELVDALRAWHERRVTIRELMVLDDHRLKDVGLHRSDVLAIADGLTTLEDILQNRPFDAGSAASTKQRIGNTHDIAANDNELASAASSPGGQNMPCIDLEPAYQNTPNPQQRGLGDKANKLMADILVVSIEEISQTNRVTSNTGVGDMTIVHADIKITQGSSISDNQTREIAATVAAFQKTIADLIEARYTVYENDARQQNMEEAA